MTESKFREVHFKACLERCEEDNKPERPGNGVPEIGCHMAESLPDRK